MGAGDLGPLTATLGCDASGLRSAEAQMRAFGASADSTFGRAGDAAASCASQFAAVAGVTLSIVGAAELAKKAMSSWYNLIAGGVNIVDDYQKKIISTSYILTTMSDVKPPDLSQAYGQWKEYMDWLYRESLRVDKMAAASGSDIFAVSTELAKKGVVAASEEQMNTIGRLTDLMKAVTPGYMNFEQQARGEIMAMMEGTARMGAQTAQILSQIDPEFKKNITSAREQGKVLEYIESILPKIQQYTLDLMGTWDAVGASLKSAWSVINLQAFGDAHREVVGLAQQLGNRLVDNGRLTADGEKLALALGQAWETAKVSISGALDYVLNNSDTIIGDIQAIAAATGTITGFAVDSAKAFLGMIDYARQTGGDIQVAMVQVRAAIDYTIEWFGILGDTAKKVVQDVIYNFFRFSNIPAIISGAYAQMEQSSQHWAQQAIRDANDVRFAVMSAMQTQTNKHIPFMGGETQGAAPPSPTSTNAPPTPPVRPFVGKESGGKGGGAGSLESAEKSVRSFIEAMNQATAQGAGDTEAILNAWKQKQLQTLAELAAKGADITQAKLALAQAVDAKQRKLDSDFADWYTQQMGHQLGALQAAEDKKLREVAGNEAKTAQVREAYALKYALLQNEQEQQRLGLAKGYMDQFAQLLPGLSEQVRYKQMSLDIEKQQADLTLNRLYLEGKITQDVLDQSRNAQAFVNQLKQFQLDQEKLKTGGIGAGLQLWGYQRAGEGETATTQGVISLMKDLESGVSSSVGGGVVAAMKGQKVSIEDTFMNAAGSGIQKGFDWITGKLFTGIADIFKKAALDTVDPLVYSGKTAGSALEVGGYNAGIAILNAAMQAQAILSGQGGGGSGLFAGLFSPSASSSGIGISSPEQFGWGGSISEELASIPMFGDGGVVTKPTLAIVGERGPEKITPLGSESSSVTINIINKTSAPIGKATATKISDREFMIELDEAVGQVISAGGKATQAVKSVNSGLIAR